MLLTITFGFGFPERSGKKESTQERNLLQKNNCPVYYTAQWGYNEYEKVQYLTNPYSYSNSLIQLLRLMLSNQIVLPKGSDYNCFESFLGEMQLVTRFNKAKTTECDEMSPYSFVLSM